MFSKAFGKAKEDYVWLINRGYNERIAKKFVGDHYRLSGTERSVLFRGLFNRQDSIKRRRRLVAADKICEKMLHIDGFNVAYTISAYLAGRPVFIANDGLLRDAAEFHGKRVKKDLLERSIALIFSFLSDVKPGRADFFIDKPLHNSSHMFESLRNHLRESKIAGELASLEKPDELLLKMRTGIICSSDSQIIDRSELDVFDLSRHVLVKHFGARFAEL